MAANNSYKMRNNSYKMQVLVQMHIPKRKKNKIYVNIHTQSSNSIQPPRNADGLQESCSGGFDFFCVSTS